MVTPLKVPSLQSNDTCPITQPFSSQPTPFLSKPTDFPEGPSPAKLSPEQATFFSLNATCPVTNRLIPLTKSPERDKPVQEAPLEATLANALIVYPESFEFPVENKITPAIVEQLSERERPKPPWLDNLTPPEETPVLDEETDKECLAVFPPELRAAEEQVRFNNESSLVFPQVHATSWWDYVHYAVVGIAGLLTTYLLLRGRREPKLPVQVIDQPPRERRRLPEPLMIEAPREPITDAQQRRDPMAVMTSSAPSFERLGFSIQALERMVLERGDYQSNIQVGQLHYPLRISDLITSLKHPFHFKSSQLAAQDVRNAFVIAQANLLESEDVFAYNLPGWPPILVTSLALERFAQTVHPWTSQLERESKFVRFSVPHELRFDPRDFVFLPPRNQRSTGREMVLARPERLEDDYKYAELDDEWVVLDDYLSRSIDELQQEVLAPVARPSRGMVQAVSDFFSGLVYGAATTYQHWYEKWIKEFGHPSKAQKYRIHLESMVRNLSPVNLDREIEILAEGRESFETPNILLESTIAVLYHLIHPQTPREQYNLVISALRNAIRSKDFKSSVDQPVLNRCRDLIRLISFTRFASTHTVDYVRNVIRLALENAPSMEYPQVLNKETISAFLECDRRRIDAADPTMRKPKYALQAQKASGSANVNFDEGRINCAYVRSLWLFETPEGEDQEVVYLRHGTPTIENGLLNAIWATATRAFSLETYRNAVTDPIYEAFLEHAERRGENLLYVSHQAYNPSVFGDESDRSVAIESNQERHLCFNFLALPMDGAISKGTSHDNATDLKAYIVRSLMRSENGFRLPRRILREITPDRAEEMDIVAPIQARYAHNFAQILDDVHRLYFGGAELNTPKLRQAFLMLAYHHLKMDMMQRFKIKYLLSACKNNIDRGNASTSVDESIWNLILNLHDDPKALDLLRYQVAGPPYLVKKQGILQNRLVLLTNVLDLIATLDPSQIAAIREYHNDKWKVKGTREWLSSLAKMRPLLLKQP